MSDPLPASVPPDIVSLPTVSGASMLRVPLLSVFVAVVSEEPPAKVNVPLLTRNVPAPAMLPVRLRMPPAASSVAVAATL